MNAPFKHPDLPIPIWEDIRLFDYLGALNERHNTVDYIAMPNMRDAPRMRLNRIFVNPLLATVPVSPTQNPKDWPQGITLYEALEQSPALVVLGDPGCGKTTLANWLAWRLSTSPGYPLPAMLDERLPICCVLREMKSEMFGDHVGIEDLLNWNIRSLLGEHANERSVAALHGWVKAKRYVLILDGIDEVSIRHRAVVAKWMQQVVADGAIVLATSRVVGYEEFPIHCEAEVRGVGMGSEAAIDLIASTRFLRHQFGGEQTGWAKCLYLMPFDERRIADFVNCWYEQRGATTSHSEQVSDLINAINASPDILELARTPNLLSLMAIVHRERANLPNGRALLYKEIANAYINTIDQQRKISPGDALARYPVEVREGWIAYIAFHMQKQRTNADGEEERGILVAKNEVLQWLSEAMSNSNMPEAASHAEEFLAWVARRSGLLLPRGEDWYGFAHLSFQEYFCARFLLGQVTSPAFIRGAKHKTLLIEKGDLGKWAKQDIWREPLIYLLELVSNERGENWLEELASEIFGEITAEGDFSYEKSRLAAKSINDQHIYFSAERKRWLAWKSADCALNSEIFNNLQQAGYAMEYGMATAADSKFDAAIASRPNNLGPSDVFALRIKNLAEPALPDCSSLQQVQCLILSDVKLNNLQVFRQMTQLWALSLHNADIDSLAGIEHFTRLKALDLTDTNISNLATLKNIPTLYVLLTKETQKKIAQDLANLRPDIKILYFDN